MDDPQHPWNYSYEDYYETDALADFSPCEKHQVKKFGRAVLPVFYVVTCGLGLTVNLTLILVFARCRAARRTIPACVACTDLVFCLTLPFWAVYAAREWIFGSHACKLVTSAYIVSLYGSNLLMACGALERCAGASCALGRRRWTNVWSPAWCACALLLATLGTVPHVSFLEAREFHGEELCTYHYPHGWRVYARLQSIALAFCAPFALALGSALWLRRSGRVVRRSAARQASTAAALLFLLWFPLAAVNGVHALQDLHIISECGASMHLDLAIQATECLAFTHVFVNPVSYLLLNRRARRALPGWRAQSHEYLLGTSDSVASVSSHESTMELTTFQKLPKPECEGESAERQGHFLPQASSPRVLDM